MTIQRSFFGIEENISPPPAVSELPPWEIDDLANQKTAKIILASSGFDSILDYSVPSHLSSQLEPGMRVMVPLGRSNRATQGYCIEIKTCDEITAQNSLESDLSIDSQTKMLSKFKIKPILSILDQRRLISESMLELAKWIASYYLSPLGQVLEAILPSGVRTSAGTRLATVLYLSDDVEKKLKFLQSSEMKNGSKTGKPRADNEKATKRVQLTPKQIHVLDTLRGSTEPLTSLELQRMAKCSVVPIDAMKRLGLIRAKTIRRRSGHDSNDVPATHFPANPFTLHVDQKRVLDVVIAAIRERRHETFLLHGVTGSGKTEVYIQAIQEVVRNKKQAIVLVPEISLTPQTVGRFKSRFSDVAVLHSHLTDSERHRQWTSILEGQVQVVVGARSAIFAPLPNLGLIVIDEEHESSFKQDTVPRYHARTVAAKRAAMEKCPLILGSATPSLESWLSCQKNAEIGQETKPKITLLSMPRRVNNLHLPIVEIVDLREEVRNRMTRGAIHRQLHQAIRETLNKKGQVILLLNRRGFSTHIQCPACGEAMKCPNCDISLTHHFSEEIALCHYCDYQVPAPQKCPKCAFAGIRYSGFGTQKLETEIKSRFPDASVLRMDTDTMQGHGAHERALTLFREGNVQILLGTQMIAKGLDFPNVTLVGVINADTAIHLPDFRASERTFHLITQVAGRTGRGERGGHVIVQTFSPDHPAIMAASKHDYYNFVKQELPVRHLLGYPPYSQMIRIIVRGDDEGKTLLFAQKIANMLNDQIAKNCQNSQHELEKKTRLLGPAPAPFAKLRGFYRFHLQLQGKDGDVLRQMVRFTSSQLKTPADIQWQIDIDPLDML
ncbi:MAG: replication restart helicase PriA [Thermoguttaceae bacterium]